MHIRTEQTPNPNALKFVPETSILEQGVQSYTSLQEATDSPLARALLAVPGVAEVMLATDFLSVTKIPDAEWYQVKPHVLGIMLEHITSGRAALEAPSAPTSCAARAHSPSVSEPAETIEALEGDQAIEEKSKALIDERVRPAVARDGGDIQVIRFSEGVLYVKLRGACSGCPSSQVTLKSGIENLLRYYIPEVQEVRAIAT